MADWDPELLPRASTPGGTASAWLAAKESGENPDALFVTNWKPVALPEAEFPGQTWED